MKYVLLFILGWNSDEIRYYDVYEPILPHCSNNVLPPYPMPPFVTPIPVSTKLGI